MNICHGQGMRSFVRLSGLLKFSARNMILCFSYNSTSVVVVLEVTQSVPQSFFFISDSLRARRGTCRTLLYLVVLLTSLRRNACEEDINSIYVSCQL